MRYRTPAYWPTRIMLAIGFVSTAIVVLWSIGRLIQPPTFDDWQPVFGLPPGVVVTLGSLMPVLVGFALMVRIFRGPRDSAPAWRYRSR